MFDIGLIDFRARESLVNQRTIGGWKMKKPRICCKLETIDKLKPMVDTKCLI